MFIRDVRRSGLRALIFEKGSILEPQVVRFARMILRERCSASYDLESLCLGKHYTLETWIGNIGKGSGTRPSSLFEGQFRRIASLLAVPSAKFAGVSQRCFVFYVHFFWLQKMMREDEEMKMMRRGGEDEGMMGR